VTFSSLRRSTFVAISTASSTTFCGCMRRRVRCPITRIAIHISPRPAASVHRRLHQPRLPLAAHVPISRVPGARVPGADPSPARESREPRDLEPIGLFAVDTAQLRPWRALGPVQQGVPSATGHRGHRLPLRIGDYLTFRTSDPSPTEFIGFAIHYSSLSL
jgi:hypothetical protein